MRVLDDIPCPVCAHIHLAYLDDEDCVSCGCGLYTQVDREEITRRAVEASEARVAALSSALAGLLATTPEDEALAVQNAVEALGRNPEMKDEVKSRALVIDMAHEYGRTDLLDFIAKNDPAVRKDDDR